MEIFALQRRKMTFSVDCTPSIHLIIFYIYIFFQNMHFFYSYKQVVWGIQTFKYLNNKESNYFVILLSRTNNFKLLGLPLSLVIRTLRRSVIVTCNWKKRYSLALRKVGVSKVAAYKVTTPYPNLSPQNKTPPTTKL